MQNFDITNTIISPEYIRQNIYSFFPDSIFLDNEYNIVGVSFNICQQLGFSIDQLVGKSISHLDETGTLKLFLKKQLIPGYFTDQQVHLLTRAGVQTPYAMSGFYMGMLTDCSEIIVLRLINRKEVEYLDRKLEQTENQIDNFIYRAAHDLRGPLATMQGLLNLLRMRKHDSDVDHFINMIESHGKKLDERLGQLVYLAKVEEELQKPVYLLRFFEVETELRKIIEKNAFVDFLELVVSSKTPVVSGYNEVLVRSMLENILLYILSIPQCAARSMIYVDANDTNQILTIKIKAQGFSTHPEMERNLNDINASHYINVLQSSRFTYLFAAQKVAAQLQAVVCIDVLDGETLEISVSIPLSSVNQLFKLA